MKALTSSNSASKATSDPESANLASAAGGAPDGSVSGGARPKVLALNVDVHAALIKVGSIEWTKPELALEAVHGKCQMDCHSPLHNKY